MPPVVIRTPFYGAKKTAKALGVSPKRTRELILLAKQAIEADPELQSLRQKKDAKKKTTSGQAKKH